MKLELTLDELEMILGWYDTAEDIGDGMTDEEKAFYKKLIQLRKENA